MKIPRIFFGTGKDVHSRAKRFKAKVIKDGYFPDISESELMDTNAIVGAISNPLVMLLADPRKSSEDHFRAYVFLNYSPVRIGEWFWQDIFTLFDGLVKTDWGLLCLIANSTYVPRRNRDAARNRRFFERLLETWPRFVEDRDLFYDQEMIVHGGAYFWQHASSDLWVILAEAGGVPGDVLQSTFDTRKDDQLVPELIRKYALD